MHLTNQSLILICEEETSHLQSTHGKYTNSHKVSELKSSQEKADTKILQKGYKNVHIRTPDSDIFFICLYYAKTELQRLNVFIDTGNGNNRRLIDATGYASGLSIEKCSAILELHAFTRCYITSCFKGIGIVKPIKVLDKNDDFELPLSQIGNSFSEYADLKVELEEFVCLHYSRKHYKETN